MMIPLLNLSALFLKIGFFSFGGGYVMLPIIYQGIQQFGIMDADEFSRLVALSQITPGPIAINASTYVGYQYAGILGASVATVSVALPSFFLVILIMKFLERFKESKSIEAVFEGIRPATVGLLASVVIFLAETSIFNEGVFTKAFLEDPKRYINLIPVAICMVVMLLHIKWKISPIKLTLLAAFAGAVIKLL